MKIFRPPLFHSILCLWLLVFGIAGTGQSSEPAGYINLASDLEILRKDFYFPALASAVIMDGKLHAAGVVGVRKEGSGVKAEIDDPFHLGSCGKAMTASLICLLVQEGKLKWETTLAEYFPDLKETMHPDYRKVTLVHLLSHRGGVPGMMDGWDPLTDEQAESLRKIKPYRLQRKRMIEILLSNPPINKPGEEFAYSNPGFALAGAIAETVMDQEWEEMIKDKLFRPLGMKTAGFGAMGTSDKIDAPWQHIVKDGKNIPINPGPDSDNPFFIAPAGMIHCSILDWAKYIQCVLKADRGEPGLLDPKLILPLKEPPFEGDYALGWSITERSWGEGRVITHAGSNGKNFCVVWVAPHKNFAVLAAANRGGDSAPEGCDEVCASMIRKFLIKE
ncbi:MAG: serine hydrolase domain-containing protein [Candidatus Omnitrophota bacterium]